MNVYKLSSVFHTFCVILMCRHPYKTLYFTSIISNGEVCKHAFLVKTILKFYLKALLLSHKSFGSCISEQIQNFALSFKNLLTDNFFVHYRYIWTTKSLVKNDRLNTLKHELYYYITIFTYINNIFIVNKINKYIYKND